MGLQQAIRFCTAKDGVQLATATTGHGPPLIRVSTWISHLVLLNGYARAYFSATTTPPALLEEARLLLKSAELGWAHENSVFRQVFIAQLLGKAAAPLARGHGGAHATVHAPRHGRALPAAQLPDGRQGRMRPTALPGAGAARPGRPDGGL